MKEQTKSSKKFKLKDLVIGIIFIVVSVYIVSKLLRLFNGEDFAKTKSIINEISLVWYVVAFLLFIISIYIRSIKWRLLMNITNYFPSLKSLSSSILSYSFSNSIIPRTGLLFRSFVLNKSENIPIDYSFGTIFIERMIDMVIFNFCILFSVLLNLEVFTNLLKKYNLFKIEYFYIFVGLSIFSIIAIIILYKKNYFSKALNEFNEVKFLSNFMIGVKSFYNLTRKDKLYYILLTFLSWVFFITFTVTFLFSFKELSLNFAEYLFIFTIGIFGFLLPTPGGIGSYHAAILIGFSMLGLSPIYGLAYGFVSHAFMYIIGMILGLLGTIYSFWKSKSLVISDIIES